MNCPNCFRNFDPSERRWNLPYCSSACRIAAADADRLEAGPDNPQFVDHLDGDRTPLVVEGGRVRTPSFNDRLAAGFELMTGRSQA